MPQSEDKKNIADNTDDLSQEYVSEESVSINTDEECLLKEEPLEEQTKTKPIKELCEEAGENTDDDNECPAEPVEPPKEAPEEILRSEEEDAESEEEISEPEDEEERKAEPDTSDKREEKESDTAKNKEKKPIERTVSLILLDAVELVAVSLAVVMLILSLIVRHSPVEGDSMLPTIEGTKGNSDLKDVLLISNLFYTPSVGDVVVVQTPTLEQDPITHQPNAEASMKKPIVKRIMAVGGDTLTIDFASWRITVNGEVIEDGWGSADYVLYPNIEKYPNVAIVPMNPGNFTDSEYSFFEKTEGCTVQKEREQCYTITIPEGYLFLLGDNRNNSKDSRLIGLVDERWVLGRAIIRVLPFDRLGTVD